MSGEGSREMPLTLTQALKKPASKRVWVHTASGKKTVSLGSLAVQGSPYGGGCWGDAFALLDSPLKDSLGVVTWDGDGKLWVNPLISTASMGDRNIYPELVGWPAPAVQWAHEVIQQGWKDPKLTKYYSENKFTWSFEASAWNVTAQKAAWLFSITLTQGNGGFSDIPTVRRGILREKSSNVEEFNSCGTRASAHDEIVGIFLRRGKMGILFTNCIPEDPCGYTYCIWN